MRVRKEREGRRDGAVKTTHFHFVIMRKREEGTDGGGN